MPTDPANVLILYSLPTDVKGAKRDEQVKEILVDVNRVHAAIGDADRAAVTSLQSVAHFLSHDVDPDRPTSVVFNLVEELPGGPGEVNSIPMLCRAFGKRCTGNRNPSRDKFLTNKLLEAHGLAVPDATLAPQDFKVIENLPDGKLIIKPTMGGGSEGISKVNVIEAGKDREAEIVKVLSGIFSSKQDAIIEQFIDGREITAGIIVRKGEPFILPLLETRFVGKGEAKPEIQSYDAKWKEGSAEHEKTPTICPAQLPEALANSIRRTAKDAWKACGCTSYCRIDFRLNGNTPVVIDVNDNPDLGVDGGIVEMLEKAGISFQQFIKGLIEQAE
jgi:D-alanine-D-alanine ligase